MDFEFISLYEELAEINEEATLLEGDYGGYKKAFLNFVNGLYYVKYEKDETEKRVKKANKQISNTNLAPVSTKISGKMSSKELADKAEINKKEFNAKTDTLTDRSDKDLVHLFNKSVAARQVATYSGTRMNDETEQEEKVYAVYERYPSVLHHMNANHEDNAILRSYSYNGKSTAVFSATDPKLFNYVLITASTPNQAKYGHMLIHLAALIIAAIGETANHKSLIGTIMNALDTQLVANNGEGKTVFTIYDPQAEFKISNFGKLYDLYKAIKDNNNWKEIIKAYTPKESLADTVKDDNTEN